MNREDIIRMAREAGAHELLRINGAQDSCVSLSGNMAIERFAALVAAHEREECAKVCEEIDEAIAKDGWKHGTPIDCAAAILARGQA